VTDLTTRYLGIDLRSPIVASASPLNRDADTVAQIEAAGAAAIVLPSLFEEEILHEEIQLTGALETGSGQFAEALDYFPAIGDFADAGERYLADIERVKARSSLPVIGSLNATSAGGWVRYAALIADAGADALELNLYHVAADQQRNAADMEGADLDVIAAVRAEIDIPLAVKLSPYYSAMANFAALVVAAGADGLVLFNRFYQPDLDLDTLDVVPRIELSHQWELRLPLRWVAILRPQLDAAVSLAATSGIATGSDVVKALMVGADVAMMASALLRDGPGHIATVEQQLRDWMDGHGYESVSQIRGSASHATSDDPTAFERANYMRTLYSWTAPGELGNFGPDHT
jgi:dihydroorotate dehydrogenase (fumarate)